MKMPRQARKVFFLNLHKQTKSWAFAHARSIAHIVYRKVVYNRLKLENVLYLENWISHVAQISMVKEDSNNNLENPIWNHYFNPFVEQPLQSSICEKILQLILIKANCCVWWCEGGEWVGEFWGERGKWGGTKRKRYRTMSKNIDNVIPEE